jgi:hypothetical protein
MATVLNININNQHLLSYGHDLSVVRLILHDSEGSDRLGSQVRHGSCCGLSLIASKVPRLFVRRSCHPDSGIIRRRVTVKPKDIKL